MARLHYLLLKDGSGFRLRVGNEVTGPLPEPEARRLVFRHARASVMSGRTVAVLAQKPDRSFRTEWIGAPFGSRVEA